MDLQILNVGKYNDMYFNSGWTNGLFGAEVYAAPEIGELSRWFFDSDTSLPALGLSLMHSTEINDVTKKVNSAPDLETKKAKSWELESLVFDQTCIYIPVVLSPTMAAKSSKIHGEYTDFVQEAP